MPGSTISVPLGAQPQCLVSAAHGGLGSQRSRRRGVFVPPPGRSLTLQLYIPRKLENHDVRPNLSLHENTSAAHRAIDMLCGGR